MTPRRFRAEKRCGRFFMVCEYLSKSDRNTTGIGSRVAYTQYGVRALVVERRALVPVSRGQQRVFSRACRPWAISYYGMTAPSAAADFFLDVS